MPVIKKHSEITLILELHNSVKRKKDHAEQTGKKSILTIDMRILATQGLNSVAYFISGILIL